MSNKTRYRGFVVDIALPSRLLTAESQEHILTEDEIEDGSDCLGVLLYGHERNAVRSISERFFFFFFVKALIDDVRPL